jgi:uncharacterized membrane protein
MNKKQRIILRIFFSLGIILILSGIIISFLKIRETLGLFLGGIGLLFLVPKFYFPVKYEEQKKNSIDYLGRKTYTVLAIGGIVLIVISLF